MILEGMEETKTSHNKSAIAIAKNLIHQPANILHSYSNMKNEKETHALQSSITYYYSI